LRRVTLAILLLVAVAVAGCGGASTVSAEQLEKQRETVHSIAAEGALLAADVERGRSTRPFAKIHSGDLSELADGAAKALAKPAGPPLEAERRREEARAVAVSDALAQLHAHPDDTGVASAVRRKLERLSG
jgi:hypothetical protein